MALPEHGRRDIVKRDEMAKLGLGVRTVVTNIRPVAPEV
jgi:hypothetical protein